MAALLRSALLSSFACLGEACEDTCCKGWDMQVDGATRARYEGVAELRDAIEGESDACKMRRDAQSDFCVKFDGGLCGIQKRFGAEYLSDACHFYPRITRRFGDQIVMGATLSCPEITRLALFGEPDPVALISGEAERVPQEMKDHLPEGMTAARALHVYHAFLAAATAADNSAEHALSRIIAVAHSFTRLKQEQWPEAVEFYFASAGQRKLSVETKPTDPFNLLHALAALSIATHTRHSARFTATLETMQSALGATLNPENGGIALLSDSGEKYRRVHDTWRTEHAAAHDVALKRWLQAQLAGALFPFAGLGGTPAERITIIGVRFATFRLALMCECAMKGGASSETVVRIAQSVARVLDHLGDPALSLKAYAETGWTQEHRLRGLLE